MEVRRALGVGGGDRRELELVLDENGYRLRPHKDEIPIGRYIGYCAEELKDVGDTVDFLRKLRGLDYPDAEE